MPVLNTPKTDPATLKKVGIVVGFFALIVGGAALVHATTGQKSKTGRAKIKYTRVLAR